MTTKGGNVNRVGIRTTASADVADANAVRAKLDKRNWDVGMARHRAFGWGVYTVSEMTEGTYYVSHRHRAVALHPSTWRTLCHEPSAQNEMIERAEQGADGMHFLPLDIGTFADAVRNEARVTAIVSEVDQLTWLEVDVQRLFVQASGVNQVPSVLQTQLFMQRYAALQAEAAALHGRICTVMGMLDIAGEAVVEATG